MPSTRNKPTDTTPWPGTDRLRLVPLALLGGGLVAVSIYFHIALARGAGGTPAPSQTDALVYMQYARAMAEGHPYVFSAGDAPSTGSTSHLYPALLAIPHLLGARGSALLTVAFLFNALCYLGFLQVFWLVARRLAPAQPVAAAALALLNGHLLMTFAGLTDMPLFTLLAWALLAALLYDRFRLAALLAALCALARPEGMVLAVALAALGAVQMRQRAPDARRMLAIAGCGLAALAAAFTLNFLLTGTAQFQSVAQKGHFAFYPLLGALGNTARDFGILVREVLFNAGMAPRQSYFLPVAGGLLAVAGVAGMARAAEHVPVVRWWILCCLASVGLVASSEWQGVATDRYLLWILPTWYLLAARGAGVVADIARLPRLLPVLCVLLVAYELASWPYFAARYASECVRSQAVVNFAQAVASALPPDAAVGTIGGPSAGYFLAPRPVRHLVGLTSPDFAGQRDRLCAVEMLKHRPESRFSHLVVNAAEQHWCAAAGMLGDLVFADVDAPPSDEAYALCTARWDAYASAALLPMDPAAIHAVAALRLADQLDVGFLPDERRCGYRVGSRLPDQAHRPCVAVRGIGGVRIVEVGQPVIGWDEFRVRAPRPGQPMRVVMRTMLDATCTVVRATEKFAGEGLHLRSPLQIRPIVNGRELPPLALALSPDPESFTECVFDIPAEYVSTDPVEIALAGDHIALAYWFYQ